MHFGVNVIGDIRGSFFIFELFQNYICCRFWPFCRFRPFLAFLAIFSGDLAIL